MRLTAVRGSLGIAENEQKGVEKGEALSLQRLLTRRFGKLPSDALERIAAANTEQLELWGDRVPDARTLAEVFHQA